MKQIKGIIKEKKQVKTRICSGNLYFKSIYDYYKYMKYINSYKVKGVLR